MFFKKKSKLSKREKEIRSYLLEEHEQEVYFWSAYAQGREEASREILEKVLDILGG